MKVDTNVLDEDIEVHGALMLNSPLKLAKGTKDANKCEIICNSSTKLCSLRTIKFALKKSVDFIVRMALNPYMLLRSNMTPSFI